MSKVPKEKRASLLPFPESVFHCLTYNQLFNTTKCDFCAWGLFQFKYSVLKTYKLHYTKKRRNLFLQSSCFNLSTIIISLSLKPHNPHKSLPGRDWFKSFDCAMSAVLHPILFVLYMPFPIFSRSRLIYR